LTTTDRNANRVKPVRLALLKAPRETTITAGMTRLVAALCILILAVSHATAREVLKDDRVYYVRCDGNDSNSGRRDSRRGAFKTFNKALAAAAALDFNGHGVVLQAAGPPCTFPPIAMSKPWTGGGGLKLAGDIADLRKYRIAAKGIESALRLYDLALPGLFTIEGFALTSQDGNALHFGATGTAKFGFIEFGDVGSNHVLIDNPLIMLASSGPYDIAGDCESHAYADAGTIYIRHVARFIAQVRCNNFIRTNFWGKFLGDHTKYENPELFEGRRALLQGRSSILARGLGWEHFPGTEPVLVEEGSAYISAPTDGALTRHPDSPPTPVAPPAQQGPGAAVSR
jgi:hypothetical protein